MATDQPPAERVIEAVWLVAIACVPLHFNGFSDRSFEPDKAALLSAFALAAAGAWSMSWRRGRRIPWREPIVLTAAAGLAVAVLAALASSDPIGSLFGSYVRRQGLLLYSACFIIFLCIATFARERRQGYRLVDAVLIALAALLGYSVAQHVGHDPVAWPARRDAMVFASLGNDRFFGSLLVLGLPLALWRALQWNAWRGDGPRSRRLLVLALAGALFLAVIKGLLIALPLLIVLLAVYMCTESSRHGEGLAAGLGATGGIVLGMIALACLLLSQGRGPFLGWLAGLWFLGLMVAVRRSSRCTATILALVLIGTVGLLAILQLAPSLRERAAAVPGIGRLADSLGVQRTARIRLAIWETVAAWVRAPGAPLVLGAGPDTTATALMPHLSSALARLNLNDDVPDRAHNDVLQQVLDRGLVGALCYLALLVAIGDGVLRSCARDPPRRLGAAAMVGGGLLAGAGLRVFDYSPILLGLAVPAGMLVGLSGVLLAMLWRGGHAQATRDLPLRVALAAALLGQVVELQVGVGSIASYLWASALLGLLVAELREPAASTDIAECAIGAAGWLALAAVLTLAFALRSANVDFANNLEGAAILGLAVLLAVPLLASAWTARSQTTRGALIAVAERGSYLGAGLGLGMLVVLGTMPRWPYLTYPVHLPLLACYLVLFGAVIAVARSLGPAIKIERPGTAALMRTLPAVVVVVALIYEIGLQPIQADIYLRRGNDLDRAHRSTDAVVWKQRAVGQVPYRPEYWTGLAESLSAHGTSLGYSGDREHTFAEARAALARAEQLAPTAAEPRIARARLALAEARASHDPGTRERAFSEAVEVARGMIALSPARPRLWVELGDALLFSGTFTDSIASYDHALALQPHNLRASFGRFTALLELGEADRALQDLEALLRQQPHNAEAWRAASAAFERLGLAERKAAAAAHASMLERQREY